MRITELFTRSKHNEGMRLDVKNGAGLTVGWLRVRGLDSDAYRAAHDGYNQAMVRLAVIVRAGAEGARLLPATQAEKDEARLAERAALIADWSFEDVCSTESITQLLRESPALSDSVYAAAATGDYFLESSSITSTNGPSTNLDSADPPQQEPVTVSPTP